MVTWVPANIGKNIIETFVFVLENADRLLLKLYFKTLDKIYD